LLFVALLINYSIANFLVMPLIAEEFKPMKSNSALPSSSGPIPFANFVGSG
jgi:hypothetical protein